MRTLIAAAALVSIGGCESSDDKAGPAAGGADKGPPPALVEVAPVEKGSLTDGWRFLGRVKAALSAKIAAATAGHVVAVSAREGDPVARGAVLVRLDAANAAATRDAAAARLTGTQSQLAIGAKAGGAGREARLPDRERGRE